MFELKSFEDRLISWSKFRKQLETSDDPLLDVICFYQDAILQSNKIDPWNRSVWPTAWELLDANRYCAFLLILGYYYSLKNTDRFAKSNCSLLVVKDSINGYITYRLKIDNHILGYDKEILQILPENLYILRTYTQAELNK